jgi:hypothetical protein
MYPVLLRKPKIFIQHSTVPMNHVLGHFSHSTVSMNHVSGQLNHSVVPKNHAFRQVSHTCSHFNSLKLIFILSSFYAQITKVAPSTRRTKENFAHTSCFQHQCYTTHKFHLFWFSHPKAVTQAQTLRRQSLWSFHPPRFIHSLHHDSLTLPESLMFLSQRANTLHARVTFN